MFYPQGFNMRTLLPNDPVAFSHYTPERRAMLASFGANTLRFQISQSHIVDDTAEGVASYLRTISTVVDDALSDGFIVIVSCQHEDPAGMVRRPVPVAATLDFWGLLAVTPGGPPLLLAFEGTDWAHRARGRHAGTGTRRARPCSAHGRGAGSAAAPAARTEVDAREALKGPPGLQTHPRPHRRPKSLRALPLQP